MDEVQAIVFALLSPAVLVAGQDIAQLLQSASDSMPRDAQRSVFAIYLGAFRIFCATRCYTYSFGWIHTFELRTLSCQDP